MFFLKGIYRVVWKLRAPQIKLQHKNEWIFSFTCPRFTQSHTNMSSPSNLTIPTSSPFYEWSLDDITDLLANNLIVRYLNCAYSLRMALIKMRYLTLVPSSCMYGSYFRGVLTRSTIELWSQSMLIFDHCITWADEVRGLTGVAKI